VERDQLLAFGKMLGETYRLQKRVNPEMVQVSDATIYGLLNGFEGVIERELSVDQTITEADLSAMCDVLDPYHNDSEREFNGFYDIEHQLERKGINRMKAIDILTYFKANGQYEEVIDRMDTSGSPGECRRFNLREEEL
jgi:hypothetical protein